VISKKVLFQPTLVIILIIRPSIFDEQQGFVGGRFTVTSLVMNEMKDGRRQVDALYTDFLKAFDIE
jgi:hypothetical protein